MDQSHISSKEQEEYQTYSNKTNSSRLHISLLHTNVTRNYHPYNQKVRMKSRKESTKLPLMKVMHNITAIIG